MIAEQKMKFENAGTKTLVVFMEIQFLIESHDGQKSEPQRI